MPEILLEMKGITKEFPGVKALDNVNLTVEKGEIHALIGENGAGKSTLMNVLSGVYPYGTYTGEIIYKGEPCRFRNIKDSSRKKIVIIHQELALVPFLSIAENIFLGNEIAQAGVINWDACYKKAQMLLDKVGLNESCETLVKDIGIGKQQLVEIAKALAQDGVGARVIMPAGSHLGGAMYLVVSPEIESLDEVVGTTLDMGPDSQYSTFWLEICDKLGIPSDIGAYYQGSDMGDEDAMMALRAGQLDIFTCCDPYASIAEQEGFGKILATAWHADVKEDKSTGWGIHCGYYINADFAEAHPELTTRLVLAHCLAIKYMYQHPYSAGEMFAETFGTSVDVGLRTMYLKTNAEGRTLCWTIDESNMENYEHWYDLLGVPEEERTLVTDVDGFMDLSWLDKCGIEDFQTFIEEEGIDEMQPLGMSYADWLYMAETIDGIDHNSEVGKLDKWMENGSKTESPIEPYTGDGVYVAPMHNGEDSSQSA